MSGLELLREYSSSSDSEGEEGSAFNKRFKHHNGQVSPTINTSSSRLPLPALFSKEEREEVGEEHSEDPTQHNGRVRRYPHERGNWSTYVYVPYVPNDGFTNLVNKLHKECLCVDNFHIAEDFHISVSKTVVLRFHWINTFVSSLRETFQGADSFMIELDSLKVYTNDDSSRTFLGLTVGFGRHQLSQAVEKIDKLLKEFNLPLFYEDPSFHLSVLWCVGNKKKKLKIILPQLYKTLNEVLDIRSSEDCFDRMHVDHLVCKTGNNFFTLNIK